MNKPSAFNKEQIRTIAIGQKRGILEELHLPPAAIDFIRGNSRTLLIVSGCLIVTALVWSFYDRYQEGRRDRSAAQFAAAIQETADDKRAEALKQIVEGLEGTEAARWAQLELAHMDYKAGNFAAALKKYQEVGGAIAVKNPLRPLVTLSIAQTYEQVGDSAKAMEQYQRLVEMPGFGGEATMGLGRLYEKENKPDQAREVYEKYLSTISGEESGKVQPNQIKSLIEARLARLKAAVSSAPTPAPAIATAAAPPASSATPATAPSEAPPAAK